LELCLDVIEKEYHSWTSQHGHNHIRKTARNRLQRTVEKDGPFCDQFSDPRLKAKTVSLHYV